MAQAASIVKAALAGRPWWVNAVLVFCAYMTFIYVPWDFFGKPVHEDVEVWFGFALHGDWAKRTEPIHWLIYAFGTYGFWKMRPWVWPAAALYTLQIAVAMMVWALLEENVHWAVGIPSLLAFSALAYVFWRMRGTPPRSA